MKVTKVCNNYVLVKFDRKREEINQNFVTRPSGIIMGEMVVDKAQHKVTGEGAWAIIRGEVMDVAALHYKEDISGLGDDGQLDYDADCEIEKGDTIIFDYHAGLRAKEKGRMWYEDNVAYGFIRYSAIFCRIREGKIMPCNGYVLIEPLIEKKKFFDYETEVISETKGIIRYAGTPVRKYRYSIYQERDNNLVPVINKVQGGEFFSVIPQIGDVVIFKSHNSRDLEYEMQRQLPHYYVMQFRDLEAVQGKCDLQLKR